MGMVETSSWRVDVLLVLFVGVLFLSSTEGNGQPLVPGLFIFGDSVVDAGNNNHLETLVKSNFPPYGRDFTDSHPTGRFCNGKLASDFTGENLGFTSYPPPILSKEANGKNLLLGANFASGQSNATSIITGSIYLLSSGSSDFIQNYYINPLLYKVYTPYQFSDILIQAYSHFIQELYGAGARKIGVSTLPPIGCLPASITIFSEDSNECVTKMNTVAVYFNKKLNETSASLKSKLSGLNLVVLDIYNPLYDLIQKPTDYGFFEARKACCGTGLVETSFLCNKESPGTCANASEYVFWDGFHPSEAANKIVADDLLLDGISLVS
ncbi:Lipase, GDSL [Cynara cardunculus var. scolymus]|uniref:Lipase, GDSL n=1 Tax=Cynara cardunculus var. scolymus TaxID=59895 RepID=A0A118JU82_CYNCS|nr:Lipase, GDSL [Cynara cardunculus var. scolymus]